MSQYTIEFLNEVESTNTYLKGKVKNKSVAAPYCVSTSIQKVGRGQRGNVWYSDPFLNVVASFLVDTSSAVFELKKLNNAATLAVVSCLSTFGIKQVNVKWPNDVFVDGEKIAGVLIENVLAAGIVKSSVVGIGLNVNQKNFNGFNATSMLLMNKVKYDVSDVLMVLYDQFYDKVNWASSKLLLELNTLLYKKDENVTFEEDGRIVTYKVKAILENGNLSVESNNNVKEIEHHKCKWVK